MVQLGVLGRLRVVVAGRDVDVGSRALQRLTIRLGLAGVAGVSVDRLQEELGVSSIALRTAVSRLRKSLGGAVVTLESGYRLDLHELDADSFERLVAEARDAAAADQVVVLDEALGLWRGRALDGVDDEPWAQPIAARLEELRVAAVEARAAAKLSLGRFVEATADARALIVDQPLRDGPRAVLMRALVGDGRGTEALRAFREYRALLLDEVGTEPGTELRALDREIAAGHEGAADVGTGGAGPVVPSGPGAGALPVTPTSFVGRTRECGAVIADLESSRVVTLVGVGGVGKTRLAVEVAREFGDRQAEEVRFADLTRASHGDEVVDVVRDAFGVRGTGSLSVEQLIEVIAADRVLLVLDNCEHVIAAVAMLVELIELRCAGITVLATSREGLGVPGERICAVAPLAAAGDAPDLFADRARAVERAFVLDEATRPVVEEICSTLDGIPLAIELAAARVRSMSVEDIAERLGDRFRLLSGVRRTAVDRHRTLGAALDWSFDLLSPNEQWVLIRLGVFAREFLLADAESMLNELDAAVTLSTLVDKSLLTRDGDRRYRLLETVKHYCLDKLAATGDLDDVRSRHAEHVLDETRRAVDRVHGADSAAGAHRVAELFPELRSAVQWAISTERLDVAMDLCAAVDPVYMLDVNLGLVATDVFVLPGARQHPSALIVEGFALFDAFLQGRPAPVEQAHALIERLLAGEPSTIVPFYGVHTLSSRGEHDAAMEAARRVYEHWVERPDSPARRWAILGAPYLTGDAAYAAECERIFEQARLDGSHYWMTVVGTALARLTATSDPERARQLVVELLHLSLDIELPAMTQTSLVTYVLLLDLDRGVQGLDRQVLEVVVREIARSRQGYRLRAQHYLVCGALLAMADELDLAARALAAHDLLGTPTSERTRAMIAVVRGHLDARLTNLGITRPAVPQPSELPALAAEIQEALRETAEQLSPTGDATGGGEACRADPKRGLCRQPVASE